MDEQSQGPHAGSYSSVAYSFFPIFFCTDDNLNTAKNTDIQIAITTNKYLM